MYWHVECDISLIEGNVSPVLHCSASNEAALGLRRLLVWYLMTCEWALSSLSGLVCPINVLAPEQWELPVDYWSFLRRGQTLWCLIGVHVDLLISLHWIHLQRIRAATLLGIGLFVWAGGFNILRFDDAILSDYNQRPKTWMFMLTCSLHLNPCDVPETVTSR